MWNKQTLQPKFSPDNWSVSWLILPDQFFILPEMSGGLAAFRISAKSNYQEKRDYQESATDGRTL